MIYNFIIDKDDFTDQLDNINFAKDIVISCPYEAPQVYDNYKFYIKNNQPLKIEKGILKFIPRFKISYPETIYVQYNTAIIGTELFHIKHEETVQFENVFINYTNKNPIFEIHERNYKLFKANNHFHGMVIKKNYNIINLNFLHTFQSNSKQIDVYLIYNNLIFQQFPNLG